MRDALRWKPAPAPPGLAAGEVQVFSASLDDLPLTTPLSWLSPDESRRASRFHFERDRRRFVATRGVPPGLLGRDLGVDPAALVFGYSPHGEPAPRSPWPVLRLHLSHLPWMTLQAFVTYH